MTARLALIIVGLLWLAWLLYWLVSARDAKANRWREPRISELRHRLPVWIAVFLLAAPRLLPPGLDRRFLPDSDAVSLVGIVLVIAGLGFAIWARVHLGRNWSGSVTVKQDHALITTGPYRHVRHPIYTGLLLAFVGTALAIGEWRGLLALVLVFAALTIKSRTEEERMRETFADYDTYRKRTAALVPLLF
jgi:protein-S-isoprenylcysteine O-methyltransferase Ste14